MYQPQTIDEYICSAPIKKTIMDAIVQGRQELLPHILLRGQSGCGKTALVNILKNETGYDEIVTVMGNSVKNYEEIYNIVASVVNNHTRFHKRVILFIDEIHNLPKKVQEILFPVLDERVIYNSDGTRVPVYSMTLVGATTDSGKMLIPFRNRFHVNVDVTKHTIESVHQILSGYVLQNYGVEANPTIIEHIANRSRGVPRTGILYLEGLLAKFKTPPDITVELVEQWFEERGIDQIGLTYRDREYLAFLKKSGSVGLDSVAFSTQLDKTLIADEIEPYLLQLGFIVKTSKGRMITGIGTQYVSNVQITNPIQTTNQCYENLAKGFLGKIMNSAKGLFKTC